MSYVCCGTARTRITLYEADGTTPKFRITLQRETREGLTLAFKPEGPSHQLGSGANWARHLTHHGFRPTLGIKWSHGTKSIREAWTGATWAAGESILTPVALSLIFTWAFQSPCLVEPRLDKAFSFEAQPDPDRALELKDLGGVAHTGLDLVLFGTELGAIPDWVAL